MDGEAKVVKERVGFASGFGPALSVMVIRWSFEEA